MKRVIFLDTFLIWTLLVSSVLAGTYSGGDGSAENPYRIATPNDLNDIGSHPEDFNDCFILVNDINMANLAYTTALIAPDTNNSSAGFQGTAFTGIFDGNDCNISNLTIDTAGANNWYLGLFGWIGQTGEVKDLGMENVNITGGDYSVLLGGLCGWNPYGTISNCYATGSVTGGDGSAGLGGLCGYNYKTISNCYATGSVTGGDGSAGLGGLCGWNWEGTISNCYATGSVTGGYGSRYLGGLCGCNDDGTISNCYATGSVTGDDLLGGLCGDNSGTISNCYFLDPGDGGGPDNGLGTNLTDIQMKQQNSFVGWDFVGETANGTDDIWTIYEEVYYPWLWWQHESAIIYVDANSTGNNDGSSWLNAYNELSDALTSAWTGDEIRVANGTYLPDTSGLADPREATFQLKNGVTIKGGYAGYGATDPNARDVQLYETILSGDLDGNDTPGLDPCGLPNDPNRGENSYHVVTGSGTDATAMLDGFTITASNANGSEPNNRRGGGMYNESSSPTVTNCTFSGNSADDWGGGMFNYDNSSPTITNCTFSGNSASDGGGGMLNGENSDPTVTNCTFIGNSAMDGGGMFNYNSSPILTNCMFNDNSAGEYGGGGGAFDVDGSNTIYTNCTFTKNFAPEGGGGMWIGNCDVTITNCIFSGNITGEGYNPRADIGAGILLASEGDGEEINLNNCTFIGNKSGEDGGGICCIDFSSKPLNIANCVFWGNEAARGSEIASVPHWQKTTDRVINIAYSNIQDGLEGLNIDQNTTLNWGNGNINADPLFVDPGQWVDANDPNIVVEPNDPNAVWIDGDYHLKSEGWRWTEELIHDSHWYYDFMTSRCIDAGNPGSPLADELMSIPDDPNNVWGENIRINMGAYGGTAEASMPPYDWALLSDITNDGTVDFIEYAHLADIFGGQGEEQPADFNRDGDVDFADLGLLVQDWLQETSWH